MKNSRAMKWLLVKSKGQNGKMLALILSNVIFSVLSIVFAYFIKEIIDSAVSGDKERLIFNSVSIIVVVILQFLLRLITNGLSEHIRAKLEMDYKSQLFREILNKRQEKIKAYHSGELLNRLTSDVSVASDGVASILPTVVSAFARLISAVIALIILDWIFAVAFTIAGGLVFIVISLLRGKLKNLHKKAQETDGKVRSFMQECIENLLAVKVFAVNDKIDDQANELQEKNFKIKMMRKNYSVLGHATYNFIFSAGYLFALIYGGVMIFTGSGLTYGALSMILQLVNNVQVPFASLSNVLPKYYAMIASAERLMEIENIEDEPITKKIDRDDVYQNMKGISVEKINFTYDRDVVLSNSSFYINKGDFIAVTGVSGAGKSTLIKLLLGIYPPDSGECYVQFNDDREDILLNSGTRSLFSYVPQGNMLFSGTLRDNVTFINREATKEQIERALKVSLAHEFVSVLPDGLDTVVGEDGVGLSEGQIQRIAIARAILSDAPILLLDEATSALDESTEKALLDSLKAMEGVTLMIVTHKKAALGICNRRLLVENKEIKELI